MSRPLTPRDRLLILLGSPARTIALLAIFASIVLNRMFVAPAMPPAPLEPETDYIVQRTLESGTLLIEDGTRVRLIGVDTHQQAAAWLDEQVTGHAVRLEFDLERCDRKHRTLAYVYLGDRLLNEELIRLGISQVQLQDNYSTRMKKRFQTTEQEARNEQRGIWGE